MWEKLQRPIQKEITRLLWIGSCSEVSVLQLKWKLNCFFFDTSHTIKWLFQTLWPWALPLFGRGIHDDPNCNLQKKNVNVNIKKTYRNIRENIYILTCVGIHNVNLVLILVVRYTTGSMRNVTHCFMNSVQALTDSISEMMMWYCLPFLAPYLLMMNRTLVFASQRFTFPSV